MDSELELITNFGKSTISRETLTDRVVLGILALIADRELRIGDALPPAREFALRFDVSVVVVREALSVLAGRGILIRRQGREPILALPGDEVLTTMLSFHAQQNAFSNQDILQCRAALEIQAAVLASTNDPQEIRKEILNELLDRLRNCKDVHALNEGDLLFHRAIARLSGNQAIVLIQAALHASVRAELLERSTTQLSGTPFETLLEMTVTRHEAIASAVIKGDRTGAANAMLAHFELGTKGLDFGRID